MVKLGNKRYKEHLKHDRELQTLIAKDQAATNSRMNKMAAQFNNQLAGVRKQLAKDRKHAENRLKKATGGVWSALWKQQAMQAKKNAAMAAATRRMRLDAIDQVRKTKAMFRHKIHKLGVTVRKNDKKADKEIEKLTGVVKANAAKSARGAKMDKDTRWLINNKLNTEISKLRSETNASVEALARQAIKARIARNAKSVSRMIRDAVSTDARARLALKAETAKAIKKTNTRVDAYAAQMKTQ